MKIALLLLLCIYAAYSDLPDRFVRYDQFNPNGRIMQVENAMTAVARKGGPVVAFRCSDGIIIFSARSLPTSSLQIASEQKIFLIDKHISVVVTGLVFDSHLLIDYMRKKCVEYKSVYGEPIPIEYLCDETASTIHLMTLRSDSRPLAVSFVVAGIDHLHGNKLYTIDPAGTFREWKASAIGLGCERIMDTLSDIVESLRSDGLTIERVWPILKEKLVQEYLFRKHGSDESPSQSSLSLEPSATRELPHSLEIEVRFKFKLLRLY